MHRTEDEAKRRSEEELKYARDEAIRCEGWFHGTGSICYGKITHRATEVLESAEDYVSLFDIAENYEMRKVGNE